MGSFDPCYTIGMSVTEVDIFSRLIDPSNPSLTRDGARAILELNYRESDHARTSELARKSNEGTLTPDERRELEGYVFVGDVLALLKSKARLSLSRQSSAACTA